MQSYTVREWDKLAYGEGQIATHFADQLAALAGLYFRWKGWQRGSRAR